MARLSKEKLDLLKKSFTEDAMTPGQAAEKVIKRSLESKLVPNLEESIKRIAKKRKAGVRKRD
ncbi:MAG: hypothetical protein DMF60_17190 [Acidobacteria bacterium]|nr:MAG: hypothetical protein DMF60_17190 [Acidobacteriota bacterium]